MKYTQAKSLFRLQAGRMSIFAICLSLLTSFTFGQKNIGPVPTVNDQAVASPSAPTPIVLDHLIYGANPTCTNLNASTDPAFAHITEDWGIKFSQSAASVPPSGTYTFTDDAAATFPRVVQGGGPMNAFRSIMFASANNNSRVTSFNSQIQITAVIIKAGNTSYAFPYAPFTFADTNLNTNDNNGISHVTFCFGLPGAPTAGNGAVSGRAVNAYGVGISNARMTITNAATGETFTGLTSPFGYYVIDNLPVGQLYHLEILHKRYVFAEKSRVINLSDSFTDIDFVASP